jgi:hypothetical protein
MCQPLYQKFGLTINLDPQPPLEVTLDPITYAIVSPPENGVIIYELFSVKDFAKKRALNVAEEESADIEDSVGISTLTTIIAF